MKIIIKEASKLIKNLIWVFCISLVAFYFIKIPIEIYKIILLLIWIYMILEYKLIKNLELYINLSVYSIVNIISFYISNLIGGKEVKSFKINDLKIEVLESNIIQYNEISKIIIVLFIFVISFFVCKFIKQKIYDKKNNKIKEKKELFEERKEDLKRLEKYLKDFNIVGIDGDWGSGKSFLTDHLEGYIKIKIDLLACNEDDIQIVVLNELDKLLKNQRIFSSYSPKLKKILRKERFFENIGDVLVSDDTLYSEVLSGLARDLDKIDGTILIIYEDLDRVEDKNVIKKILGISEKISSNKVKILHQFSCQNLNDKGIDRNYLEKYIPFIVKITDIPFFSVLEYVIDDNKEYKNFSKDDFKFLKYHFYDPYIKGVCKNRMEFKIVCNNVTIRRMKYFLDEVDKILSEEEEYIKNKKDVILILFIKHFRNETYLKIIPGKSLMDTFLFEYNDEERKLKDWEKYCKEKEIDMSDIINNAKNEESRFILGLFGYNFNITEKSGYEAIMLESERNLEYKNLNEKKDQIIWSVISNGEEKYSESEKIVNNFIVNVIDSKKGTREDRFKKFLNDTPPLIGVPMIIYLFKNINKVGIDDNKLIDVIDCCFEEFEIEEIDIDIIAALNYCNLDSRKNYIHILDKFNRLKIKGNLNSEEVYKLFLVKYLSQLSSLGFCDTYQEISYLENIIGDKILIVDDIRDNVFSTILKKLKPLYDCKIDSLRKEIVILVDFINKNIELIAKDNIIQRNNSLKMQFKSVNHNQEIIDKIEANGINIEEIEENYIKGNLRPYEVKELIDKTENRSI